MQAQSGRASLTKPVSGTTMNAPNTRASSGNLQQQQLTGLPGQSAAAVQASRSGQGSRSRQSSRSGQPTRPANTAPSTPQPAVARAQPAVSKTPPGKQQQVTQSAGEKAAIQKREEQAKVLFKFRDSFKQFFFLPTCHLGDARNGKKAFILCWRDMRTGVKYLTLGHKAGTN
ncbi:uncharacterized protein LOC122207583 isoform X4 [Panthera leo]|uniref:uncharacterized protein LOC122207583 isoform X4 n=1 Tax=Panthera leo TaxID=9689 RepID=UPI001C696297|nr:uncharacterized protein LOC122207583 isoform X4 [Panthera leo]